MTENVALWILDELWKTPEWLGITWLTLGWRDLLFNDFGMVLIPMTLGWLLIDFELALGCLDLLLWNRACQKVELNSKWFFYSYLRMNTVNWFF